MSMLNGLLRGRQLYSAIGAAIDRSHHPFKRDLIRPGGPAGKKDAETKEWSCSWKKPYVQKCVAKASHPGGKPRVKYVRIKRAYKKAYNKQYRAGKFPKGRRFQKDIKHPGASYPPRRSSTWAAASSKKR